MTRQHGRKPIKAKGHTPNGSVIKGGGKINTRGRSLHEIEGITPSYYMPPVPIANLTASELKTLGVNDLELDREIMSWLRRLAIHPRVPDRAMRQLAPNDVPYLHVGRLTATSKFPWWQIESLRLNDAGIPERDLDHQGTEPRFHAILVYPPIPPPPMLIAAFDEAVGGKLTNRGDGGPTPNQPRGSGSHLPDKREVRR